MDFLPELPTSQQAIEPHNVEAEQAVLGSILMNQAAFFEVSFLSPEDFYIHKNGWVFQAIKNLIEKNKPVDSITLCDEMGLRLQEAGGAAYIVQLMSAVPTSVHAASYGKMVEEESIRRKMLVAASNIAMMANDDRMGIQEVLSGAENTIRNASTSRKSEDRIPDALDAAGEFVELMNSNNLCIPTGIGKLDYLVGGLETRKLTILGGRPMKGKTCLAFQFAQNIAMTGRLVLFLSAEMDRASLLARRICGIAGVDWRDVIAKRAGPDSLLRLENCAIEYGHKMSDRLLIDDDTSRNCDAIYRLVYKYRPDAVIADHAALFARNERGDNMNYLMGRISKMFKSTAKEFNCASLLLCQLSRYKQRQMQEGASDGEPELIDLRDSGELEQDADNVWFLHYKDHKADEKPPPTIESAILVKKFRAGQSNLKCNLVFDLRRQWFTEPQNAEPTYIRVAQPPEPEPPEMFTDT
jgi:replicative DNA helicase